MSDIRHIHGIDPLQDTGSAHSARPVAVVGAGPTGLLLAGDLAEAGVPVTLVEKRDEDVSNLSRAFVVHARTLEQLDARRTVPRTHAADASPARSVADELVAVGRRLSSLRFFGDRLRMRFDTLPSRFAFVLMLPQYEVESALLRRAVRAGVRFAYRTEATGLTQDEEGVTLRVTGPDGRDGTLRAVYAVGADGMGSTVRKAIGLPFPGRSEIRSLMLADVRLAEPPDNLPIMNAVSGAVAFLAPFGDGYYRFTGWHRSDSVPDSEPLELDEVRRTTRLALGRDYGMHDARWLSRFHCDERQAPSYRVGRVFLAGDAAHVHTPVGGQGMNIGLQDAANLSWKLAAVLGGRAPGSLLDSYQAERHPIGRSVLRSSGGLIRLAMANRPWTLAARAALTGLVSTVPAAHRALVGRMSGIGYSYPSGRGAHPLTGRRMPDVPLAGGGRLHEALRGGRAVLIGPPGADIAEYGERVAVVRWADGPVGPSRPSPGAPVLRRAGHRGSTVVLVRPDGYAGWAAESPTAEAVAAAVELWTGAPVRSG